MTTTLRPYPLELWRDDNPMPVTVHATVTRVSGEPGSLSIAAGYEIDISRVTFRGNPIDISPAERADIEREILNKQNNKS